MNYVLMMECPLCGEASSVEVDAEKWKVYEQGRREGRSAATHGVQVIFPELTPGQRETIISGCHEECFDRAFASDEDVDFSEGEEDDL